MGFVVLSGLLQAEFCKLASCGTPLGIVMHRVSRIASVNSCMFQSTLQT